MRLEERRWVLLADIITFTSVGKFDKTTSFLKRMLNNRIKNSLVSYAKKGVDALSAATPRDTGETADSWYYEIYNNSSGIRIIWKNSKMAEGVPVAVLIQYGHVTKNGGYYPGLDYINPAIEPIVNEISEYIRKELCRD